MEDISLRQIRAVVAVCEESSFTRAAERECATQSGISQRIAAVERVLGVKLFERSCDGVRPTPAGARYYSRCLEALDAIRAASDDVRHYRGRIGGHLRIGLTPAFARAALPATLNRYVREYPDVKLHLFEGYSSVLIDKVCAEQLDFAVVAKSDPHPGISSRLLVRDREMLVSGGSHRLEPLEPVRLRDIRPLKFVSPGARNVHHRNVQAYFKANEIHVDEMIEIEGIVGTLEFVAVSDWVTIQPALMINNFERLGLVPSPIIDPPMYSDFMVIMPARCPLSGQARLFLERFESEVSCIHQRAGIAAPPTDPPEAAVAARALALNGRRPAGRKRATARV